MSDDIVIRLRELLDGPVPMSVERKDVREAASEIEQLRALCNDLHHDATCHKSFCRLCGEGIREWEARRG